MMELELNFEKRGSHFIGVKLTWELRTGGEIKLQLPLWRPGRYESAHFAQHIYKMKLLYAGRPIELQMVDDHNWVSFADAGQLELTYEVLANELNAGSSYVDADTIYLNPINWLIYPKGQEESEILVDFQMPGGFDAYPLTNQSEGKFSSIHDLLDTPLLAGRKLTVQHYSVDESSFEHVILGPAEGFASMIPDFEKFTKSQLDMMGTLPVDHYRFLTISFPHRAYHGVEHQHGCVMTFGPYYSLNQRDQYLEFLGLASHELFHVWNVKHFRASEHSPYDYDKQVASSMGYVLEGFTTYYGDLFMARAGVFKLSEYLLEWKKSLDRYLSNFGRYNLSLAESSRQTWVDGYVKSGPDRKVSIYNEGALFAFLLDRQIRNATNEQRSLDDVLRLMYKQFGPNKGYTQAAIQAVINEVAGSDLTAFVDQHLNVADDWTESIVNALSEVGLAVDLVPSADVIRAYWGVVLGANGRTVEAIHPLSPALNQGLAIGDEILRIGEVSAASQFPAYCRFWKGHHLTWQVKNKLGQIREVLLRNARDLLYQEAKLTLIKDLSKAQKSALASWLRPTEQ